MHKPPESGTCGTRLVLPLKFGSDRVCGVAATKGSAMPITTAANPPTLIRRIDPPILSALVAPHLMRGCGFVSKTSRRNDQSRLLPLAPLELGTQDLEVVAPGGFHQPQDPLGARDGHAVVPEHRDAALAVEQYRRTRGRLPASLADLVPEWLPAAPRDPLDPAQPLGFTVKEDRFQLTAKSAAARREARFTFLLPGAPRGEARRRSASAPIPHPAP